MRMAGGDLHPPVIYTILVNNWWRMLLYIVQYHGSTYNFYFGGEADGRITCQLSTSMLPRFVTFARNVVRRRFLY